MVELPVSFQGTALRGVRLQRTYGQQLSSRIVRYGSIDAEDGGKLRHGGKVRRMEGKGRGGKGNEEEDYEMRECELLIAFASEGQEERQLTSAKR